MAAASANLGPVSRATPTFTATERPGRKAAPSSAPKGAVVVTSGRGTKSQARSDGRAAAKPGARKSKPGAR